MENSQKTAISTANKIFGGINELNNKHIHFVGIKGTGMAALVEICAYRGAIITGSDVQDRFYTDEILETLKISATTFSEKNITEDIDLVVFSSAYLIDKNPELIKAQKIGIPMVGYAEALGALSSGSWSCGIAGVHGKTSTTAICGTILEQLNLPVQVLAGSVVQSFQTNGKKSCSHGSCTLNIGQKYFIAETCEYQRHFMNFHPNVIILTSVESDHQDYYPTYEDIRNAFVDYCCLLPKNGKLIYCADDNGALEVSTIVSQKRPDIIKIPYGFTAIGDFSISNYLVANGKQTFTLNKFGNDKLFSLFVPGKHNVLNSTACVALASEILEKENSNIIQKYDKIVDGLISFHGSRRRCEIVADIEIPSNSGLNLYKHGVPLTIIDDYGHHPTAIQKTLEGLRDFYNDRYIIVDFMSHTYTRTAALFERFAQCFNVADLVILNKIYPSAREIYNGKVTGKTLYEETKKYHSNVFYAKEFEDASSMILDILNKDLNGLVTGATHTDTFTKKRGFLLVTMGAGDNWKVGVQVLDTINNLAEEAKK
jgi:UDP-N-acetylmuramate--alanine ligase